MQIKFSLNYFTAPYEELKAVIKAQKPVIITLKSDGCGNCSASLQISSFTEEPVYYYAVYENGLEKRREYPFPPRRINCAAVPEDYTLNLKDAWRDTPPFCPLSSSAFSRESGAAGKLPTYNKTLILKAYAPQLKENQTLKLCGADKNLGEWHISRALPMQKTALNEWTIALNAEGLPRTLEFKFIAVSEDKILWQQGRNNLINSDVKNKEILVKRDFYPSFELPSPRAAGIVLPVFSLKSESSFGAGDFGDLKKLADWAAACGQKIIQILPINDTSITGTWTDSYPYNSISIYAFHPMYMDLKALGPLSNKSIEDWFSREQKRLNALSQVNYEEVNLLKRSYIKMAFEEQHRKVFKTEEYQKFFEENKDWLRPYAAFRYLRNKFNTPNFRQWPQYKVYDRAEIAELTSPKSKVYREIALYYYTQYNLHRQLLDAASYARSKGIIIKGDIPIGISRDSVEAWTEPHYFNLDSQAGAPPDDFSVNGQNWGFPTYNWEAMAKDGYSWWKKRFKKMAEYFDAYRIDHVLGFFRIWEIPLNSVHGLLGQFSPALPMDANETARFGFNFRQEYLNPRIDEALLKELFGGKAQEVKEKFLMPSGKGFYAMRTEFDTQRKVEEHFSGRTDKESLILKERLYSLISNVLFVRDKKNSGLYHPRISALSSAAFKALDDGQKRAYTNLYNHYFYHRHNDFWKSQAMAKLPALVSSTRMLACAEDLGMIPACVPEVMDALQILSLEVQRMPKSPLQRFGDTSKYPQLSVCTVSTHDMSTLRGWWKEDAKQTQAFYNEVLGKQGSAPKEASAEICEEVIKRNLASPSMLCILSYQDWLSTDGRLRAADIDGERINIPANPRHYWRYRMNHTIEELSAARALNTKIKSLIAESGRL